MQTRGIHARTPGQGSPNASVHSKVPKGAVLSKLGVKECGAKRRAQRTRRSRRCRRAAGVGAEKAIEARVAADGALEEGGEGRHRAARAQVEDGRRVGVQRDRRR
eukprot:6196502-Pleurochrysis_carterae.AAC.1